MSEELKAIAMYLPQFHNVKENNEWWGEGFTDWVALKRAKSLFEGHVQPKHPLNHNYYDLMKKETVMWQAELMHQYGIYGLCYYHYWFKDERRILEKPAENLLKWRDIDMPFCFCWANQSWARSWSNVPGKNAWADTFESKEEHSKSKVLLDQKYGDEENWGKHLRYLIPFFKDRRYIKVDDRPMFLIYSSKFIANLLPMVTYWNNMLEEEGIPPVYLIGINSNGVHSDILDAEMKLEPSAVLGEIAGKGYRLMNNDLKVKTCSYDVLWEEILARKASENKVFYSGFSNYDDTPRRGRSGYVVTDGTAEKFKKYLTELYAKNYVNGNEFVFVNAWNEWGEGMYVEPDEEHKFEYLEAFPYARDHFSEHISHYKNMEFIKEDEEIVKMRRYSDKFETFSRVLDKWLLLKEENLSLADYLIQHGYYKIAIYGMGMLGRHLVTEFAGSPIEICYAIDQNASSLAIEIPVLSPNDNLPEVDLIIVTVVQVFSEVYSVLQKKVDYRVRSLEGLIDECYVI